VYTASGDQAFCSLENVSSCKKKKQRRRMFETMEKKPIFIFTGRILLLCCLAGSVCKIDITLYIISFLEKYCKLSSPGPLLRRNRLSGFGKNIYI
jgi:hypothetical protein